MALADKAAEHFKDATCHSLMQWGTVFNIRADRQGQALVRAGKAIEGKVLDAMMKEYDESEKKYNEALKIKPEFWEATGCMGQLEWERAKAKLGYIVPVPSIEEAKQLTADQVKEESIVMVKAALAKIDPKKVGQVGKHIEAMNKWFDKALGLAKASDEKRKAEEEAEEAAAKAKAGEEAADKPEKPELTEEQLGQQKMQTFTGNMLVSHGNILYEWSQVLAAINKPEWRAVLDTATEKFRSAGAAEADVRQALKNHTRKEDLDLGPDPEPVAAPAAAKAPEAPAKTAAPEAAKGLPSLEVKKKPAPAAKA